MKLRVVAYDGTKMKMKTPEGTRKTFSPKINRCHFITNDEEMVNQLIRFSFMRFE